jgi:hypothetical protein
MRLKGVASKCIETRIRRSELKIDQQKHVMTDVKIGNDVVVRGYIGQHVAWRVHACHAKHGRNMI